MDPLGQRLLRSRANVFDRYDEPGFRRAFARGFEKLDVRPLSSGRTLFLPRARGAVAGGDAW